MPFYLATSILSTSATKIIHRLAMKYFFRKSFQCSQPGGNLETVHFTAVCISLVFQGCISAFENAT